MNDNRFHMAGFRDVAEGLGINLVLLGLLLGASFIGAEWTHRTITTQLTWEPRRARVLAAKMLASALVVFVGAVTAEFVLGLSLLPAAAFRGTTEGVDAAWLRDVAGVVLRASALAALASVMAASVATVARNTAGALAIGFGYLAVLERLIAGVKPRWQPWLIGENAVIFVSGHSLDFRFEKFQLHRSVIESLAVLAIYAAVLVAVGTGVFRRTDIA